MRSNVTLKEAVEQRNEALRVLLETCVLTGAIRGINKYLLSPDFAEEAYQYCREMGWKEPE